MKIWLHNSIDRLTPIFPSDYDEKKKLKIGQDYEADIKLPRNIQFHKKAFALFNIGHQNTKLNLPFNVYRKMITMRAGYFKAYQTDKGILYEADSLSFGSMDQETFEECYSRVLDQIIKDVGLTSDEVENELTNFM